MVEIAYKQSRTFLLKLGWNLGFLDIYRTCITFFLLCSYARTASLKDAMKMDRCRMCDKCIRMYLKGSCKLHTLE